MITVIPGFLGTMQDWDLISSPKDVVDLFNDPSVPQRFSDWPSYLCNRCSTDPKILIGYSLGGRIALHALCQYPDYFQKAIIISAHTGLNSSVEKSARLTSDATWAERFASEAWGSVMTDWNSQDVLKGASILRSESDYNRSSLSLALTNFSLGNQENLLPLLSRISTSILWITGERDEKFTLVAESASRELPNASHWICPEAGHRVLWENTAQCRAKIEEFLA